jgi:polyisoprenyl-teichoic acid--peptidoglycan teichoic acid transferase
MEQARRADPPRTPRPPLRRSRTLGALLSFLIPGTGQLLEGRIRVGLFFLAPFLLAILIGIVVANGDRGELLGFLVEPTTLLGIAVLDVLLFVWRAAAILDAWWGGGSKVPHTILSTVAVVVLLAITGATHYVVGAQVMAIHDTFDAVFSSPNGSTTEDDGFGELPAPTEVPSPIPTPAPGTTAAPTPLPTPTPAPTPRPGPLADGRLDVLLVGGDAGPGRWSLRTDTLMVLSVDVKSGEAALFSIPRNMVNVPLPAESRKAYPCGCFPQLINALYVVASNRRNAFPGNDEVRGLRAVQMTIGELVGRKLDGMVVVKLQGFIRLIDAIGGLDINVPEAVHDKNYPLVPGHGRIEIFIPKGKQHMNGRKALMYARSRHMDSDYGRMERQQIVITALGRQLLREPLIVRLPELLEIAKDNLWTNLKTGDLPDLARLAEDVDIRGMEKVRFVPPKYPSYLDRAAIRKIRALVRDVFDDAAPLATPTQALPTPTPYGP